MAGKLIAAVLAGTVVVAGCAEDPKLDVAALEGSISEALLPAVVDGVKCPRPLLNEAQTVVCEGAIGGVAIEIEATIEPDADPLVAVEVDAPLLDVAVVAAEAGARLSKDLDTVVEVECPPPVVVIQIGAAIACTVTDADTGINRPLTIRLTDTGGGWEMDLFP